MRNPMYADYNYDKGIPKFENPPHMEDSLDILRH
jgi:hypothetical protein